MAHKQWTDEMICAHWGEEQAAPMNAVVPPLYLNSLHTFDTIEEMVGITPRKQPAFTYGRGNNPTADLLEKKLAALEKGEGALAFGSGMAAITTSILACAKSGGHIIAVSGAYGPTRSFLSDQMQANFGIETTFVNGRDIKDFEDALRPNTQLIYLESPSSFVFHLQDIVAVTTLAKSRDIKTIIDNTWATPLFQKPITMGVDIVVHTLSKYIGGHSDIIGGAAIFADGAFCEHVRDNERALFGGILGPFEAWLAIRGLRSLSARLERHQKNAMEIARRLEAHPMVKRVNYVGLDSFPQKELAQKQLAGCSGLMSFVPNATAEQTLKFMNALKVFQLGVSWGGFESLAVLAMYNWTEEDAVAADGARSLVRLAVGMEDVEAMWADLTQALDAIK